MTHNPKLIVAIKTKQEMIDQKEIPFQEGDFSTVKFTYFKQIPEDLKVTPKTPVGTQLLLARSFTDPTKPSVGILAKHKPNGMQLDVNIDGKINTLLYNSVAIMVPKYDVEIEPNSEINENISDSVKQNISDNVSDNINQAEESNETDSKADSTSVKDSNIVAEPGPNKSKSNNNNTPGKANARSSTIRKPRHKTSTNKHNKKGNTTVMARKKLTKDEAAEKGLDLRKNEDRVKAGWPPITGRGRKPGSKNKKASTTEKSPNATLRENLGIKPKRGRPSHQPISMDGFVPATLTLTIFANGEAADPVNHKFYQLTEL